MLKKIFRWLLWILGISLLLLVAGGTGLYVYVDNNKDRAAREAAETLGFDLDYADARLTAWSTWPRVMLTMDSVAIKDKSRSGDPEPLLKAGRLDVNFDLGRIWEDTLRFESINLAGGGLYLISDSTGSFNLGALAKDRDTTSASSGGGGSSWLMPVIDWEGAELSITDFEARYTDSLKNKWFATRIDSLQTRARTDPQGLLRFDNRLVTHVEGLTFNVDKGAYLRNADLSGNLNVIRTDTAWVIDTTVIRIGPDAYGLFAAFGRNGTAGVHLNIRNPQTVYDRARSILHDTLAARMTAYDVQGPFAVVADLYDRPEFEGNAKVFIQFSVDGNPVNLNGYRFTGVKTAGTFVNRLPVAEGGTGSKRDFKITTSPTVAYYLGMRVESPGAIIRGVDNHPYFESPIRMRGTANDLARMIGNTDFLFVDGAFEMNTFVDASLLSIADIIGTSDGTLRMRDLDVDYQPAGVRFSFGSIDLAKDGEDVRFALTSGDFPTGLDFRMDGTLDNILPLLLERPADSIRTTVNFTADRLDWSGFRALFGQESFADSEYDPAAEANSDAQIQSMKRTLLGLQNTFRPRLVANIGEMAYYEDLRVTDFHTGLHFERDTLVLEQTTFDWAGSSLAFSGRFGMGTFRRTPFRVEAAADQLDLNTLRRPLTAFGLQLPRGIDTLPADLEIRFVHRGIINDTFGIIPGTNAGRLDFHDVRESLFSGNVAYRPVGGALRTKLQLEGNPEYVNRLFAAEDFLFGTGHFRIDVDVDGVPEDLGELVSTASLRLRIDSTRLNYRPAGAFVPIRSFVVNAAKNRADLALTLTSDATRSTVGLNGELRGLTAFLYPDRKETFRVRADAYARKLHVSDLNDFISFDELTAAPTDTSKTSPATTGTEEFNPQTVLSASEGIFSSFRPDLSLRIDTFGVDKTTTFTDVHAGLRIRDSTLLVIERTGFGMDAGRFEIAGTYNLDRRLRSPFTLQWQTDSVVLNKFLLTLKELGLPGMDSLGVLRGILATSGDLDGRMDEKRRIPLLHRSRAGVNVMLSPTEIAEWPGLEAMGKKMLMRKRFQRIFTAPLSVALAIDSGRVHVPRTELQSTALQLFVQGHFDTLSGPDLLIAVPVFANIGRGKLRTAPPPTGYAHAGWKVFLVMEPGEDGTTKTRFRLGRRKYYKERGRLAEFRELKREEKAARKARR